MLLPFCKENTCSDQLDNSSYCSRLLVNVVVMEYMRDGPQVGGQETRTLMMRKNRLAL
jgi:hypothetical protein